MDIFTDITEEYIKSCPDYKDLGLCSSKEQFYLVGVSNPALGIDVPILGFRSLSKAKDFISSTPVTKGCFYSLSIIALL